MLKKMCHSTHSRFGASIRMSLRNLLFVAADVRRRASKRSPRYLGGYTSDHERGHADVAQTALLAVCGSCPRTTELPQICHKIGRSALRYMFGITQKVSTQRFPLEDVLDMI